MTFPRFAQVSCSLEKKKVNERKNIFARFPPLTMCHLYDSKDDDDDDVVAITIRNDNNNNNRNSSNNNYRNYNNNNDVFSDNRTPPIH